MAGRRNRNRLRRRLRAESSSFSFSPSSGSSSSDRAACGETPDPRWRTRDARALQPLLLGLIRGHYLDAISRLPTAELSTTLARGLLIGGHCYGPLHPVHNIIVNSVWYAAASRAVDSIDASIISTEGLSRLAQRSLDGLVASLRYHCPALSHEDALWHLCLSGADLRGAAASARGAVPYGRTELQAHLLEAAAKEARHPEPAAVAALLATSGLPSRALSLLAGKRRLSSPDILRLSAMLLPDELPSPPPSPSDEPNPRVLRIIHEKRVLRIIHERRRMIKNMYLTWLDLADAALRKFGHQTGAHYHLHTIYDQSILLVDEYGLDRYFQINFIAWPRSSVTKTQAPVRFFAEAHNPPLRNCPEEKITLCCMLVHVGSCYACVTNNREIDHGNAEEHCGGRPYRVDGEGCDGAITIDVDYRFFDPERETDLMEYYASGIAYREAMCSSYHLAKDDSNSDDVSEDTFNEDIAIYCRRYV